MNTQLVPAPTATETGSTVVPVNPARGGRSPSGRRRDPRHRPAAARDPLAHAARARRLAELHSRRARWWAVLERSIVGDHDMPIIHAQAAYAAVTVAEREARFWSDTADDWQARADRRPTSEIAGPCRTGTTSA